MHTIELPARIDDPAELGALVREFLRCVEGQFAAVGMVFDVDANLALTFDDLAAYLPPEGRVIVALAPDGGLDGCVFLHRVRETACEVKRLWVRPRGRGAGLGRALMERAIDEARALGLDTVLLDTGEWDRDAHRLYRRLGFVEVDAFPESQVPPELRGRLHYFRLDLDLDRARPGR